MKAIRRQEIPELESKDFIIATAVARVLAFSCTNFPSPNHTVMKKCQMTLAHAVSGLRVAY